MSEKSVDRHIFLSKKLDEKIEEERGKFGLNRSEFIRHALLYYFNNQKHEQEGEERIRKAIDKLGKNEEKERLEAIY